MKEIMKCPYCEKEYTNEKYYNLHIDKCAKIKNDDVYITPVEETIENDTNVSIEEDNVLDERYEGLTKEEISLIDNFCVGFRFSGQIKERDMDLLEKVYKLKIKSELPGQRDCSSCRIAIGRSITSYFTKK